MAQSGPAAGADARDRPGPPRLGLQGAARDHRGRPQARPAALRRRHQQPRARHRHGRGRPRHPGRVAADRGQRPAARRPRRPPGRRGRRAACCSPSTAATSPRPRSPSSGCAPARSSRCACPTNPLDVLAQQIVAATALDAWAVDDLVRPRTPQRAVRHAAPRAYDATLDLLAGRYPCDEFAELRPRIVWDRVAGTLTGRPGAQRLAVTSGGTIPDRGLFGVFLVGRAGTGRGSASSTRRWSTSRGSATSSRSARPAGGSRTSPTTGCSSRPRPGIPGRLPFWKGDALGRPAELGEAIGAFTRELAALPGRAGRRPRRRAPGSTPAPPTTWSPTSHEQRRGDPASLPSDRTLAGRAVPRRARRLAAGRALPLRHAGARAVGAGDQRPAPRALRRRRPGDGHRRRHRGADPRDRRRAARRRALRLRARRARADS